MTTSSRVGSPLPEVLADPAKSVGVAAVSIAELSGATARLAELPGTRLADMFAAGSDPVTLRLVWALDGDQRYVVTESAVAGPQYPALSDITPAAFTEECEIYEQFGIRPAGGKPLNRVAVPPQHDIRLPRLGAAPREPAADVHALHTVGGQAFEFPFGPVRQVGVESLYYGIVTSGEEVVDVYLLTWHKHRGFEYRAQGQTPQEALFYAERVEGLSAVGNGWAFAAAAETALDVDPGHTAQTYRGVALELERLYNHAASMAALCQACGLAVGRAAAEIALEQFLRLNARVFGHRYLFGVVAVGGCGRPPDVPALHALLPAAYDGLRRTAELLLRTNSFVDRLEATGIVTAEQAARLGLVGPVLRGSGISTDARVDHPSGPYRDHRPAVAVQTTGDALARLRVMLAEATESVRLIGELAGDLGSGHGQLPDVPRQAEPGTAHSGGTGLGWAESSRGESLAWLELDRAGRISRARIRPAAVRNWRGFDDACRAQNVFTDIPIIEASFWLTVAGTAR